MRKEMQVFIEENELLNDASVKEIGKSSASDEIFKDLNILGEQDIKNLIKEVNKKRDELIDHRQSSIFQNHEQKSIIDQFYEITGSSGFSSSTQKIKNSEDDSMKIYLALGPDQ